MPRKLLESNILVVNTVHILIFAWFCIHDCADWKPITGIFALAIILDCALVHWQNVAICECKNTNIQDPYGLFLKDLMF